jgi:hypothetical protein
MRDLLRGRRSKAKEFGMRRLLVLSMMCWVPAAALAGGNPLLGAPAPAPGAEKKYQNLLKGDRQQEPCDERGLAKDGSTNCKPVEPVYLPRDGVTDDLLEKYRIRK